MSAPSTARPCTASPALTGSAFLSPPGPPAADLGQAGEAFATHRLAWSSWCLRVTPYPATPPGPPTLGRELCTCFLVGEARGRPQVRVHCPGLRRHGLASPAPSSLFLGSCNAPPPPQAQVSAPTPPCNHRPAQARLPSRDLPDPSPCCSQRPARCSNPSEPLVSART